MKEMIQQKMVNRLHRRNSSLLPPITLPSNDSNSNSRLFSFLSEGQVHRLDVPAELKVDGKTVNKEHFEDASLLENELNELQERYLNMSFKYAEVEAQIEELISKLKAVRPGKSWFS